MATENERRDVISVLTADHRAVERAFTDLGQETSPEQRGALAEHIISELVRHSVAEELHLYPTVRSVLPDGDELAEHHLQEHANAEITMKDLEQTASGAVEFDRTVQSLMEAIRHHVTEEENDLFPKLREVCATEQLESLGDKILRAKAYAPTRPHPAAPDEPPMNRILAPGAGLVDRARDALTGRET